MYSKAVFIDFKSGEIEKKYFDRISSLFTKTEFIFRDDLKLKDSLKDTEVIFTKFGVNIDKEVIDAAPNLKYIGKLATAFDDIDVKYARSKNITVCNLGGYSTEAVAEFFFAALFERVRDIEKAKLQARSGDYSFNKFMGLELKGRTLGVVGAGKIGSRVAKIGLAMGMKVLYFSREHKEKIDSWGAAKKELDEILSQSDFVSLNLSLNQETQGIINKDKIALLKKGCVFINLAPPSLIDQEAMMKRAGTGDITFIFDHSDDIDAGLAKRFLQAKGCIVYPPVAFRTEEANTTQWETFVSNIENFAKGKPQNVVS